MHVLKDGAGWVAYKGNPFAHRGMRITPSHTRLGIKHMDIYYAIDEECPWKVSMDGFEGIDKDDAVDVCLQMCDDLGIPTLQLTKVTLVTGARDKICAWAGEVSVFSDDLIRDLLAEDLIEIVPFAHKNPVWDEETRDIIGGMMIDGMTMQQAQAELVRAGEMKLSEMVLPSYFYRPIGAYRDIFVEE